MDVTVDAWAWLPKKDLTFSQLHMLKKTLTVVPRKMVQQQEEDPKPVYLFHETPTHIAIAREYFNQNRRPEHKVTLNTTLGHSAAPSMGQFSGVLRHEQQLAVDTLRTAFHGGRMGGLLQAKPGAGKTVMSCALAAALDVPTMVLVHKEFLMNQWMERIRMFLPDAKIGRAQQDECDYEGKSIVLGMIHSVGSGRYSQEFYDYFGLVISDECFLGTQAIRTLAGPVPISRVAVGTAVFTATGTGVVEAVGSRQVPVARLVEVGLKNSASFVCTEGHPILTARGWVPAAELRESDEVVTDENRERFAEDMRKVWETEFGSRDGAVLFERVLRGCQKIASRAMRGLWQGGQALERADLFRVLCREAQNGDAFRGSSRAVFGYGGQDEPAVRERAHDRSQPDAAFRGSPALVANSAPHGASPASARRERAWLDRAAGFALGGAWRGLVRGACDSNGQAQRQWIPDFVQGGLGVFGFASSGGSGWQQPLHASGEETRREENGAALRVGVASVARVECARVAELGGDVDGDQNVRVWNLRVSGHPSYVLGDGTVVHNCHHIGAQTFSQAPPRFRARYRVGLSATPRRKDGAENVFLYQIGPVLFTSKEERLKFKVKRVWTKFHLVKTDKFNPSLVPRTLVITFLCASEFRNRVIIEQLISALQAGRKVIVLSERLKHLQKLNQFLGEMWPGSSPRPTVGFYVGGKKEHELDESRGANVVFATVQFASEGLDIPELDTLFLTTPISDVEQAVGRILRPHEKKKEPVVVDFRDDAVSILKKQGEKRDRYYDGHG